MKAPDKIYAGTITEGIGITKHWQVCRDHLENPVEYIRKDALLEWAKPRISGLCFRRDDSFRCGYEQAVKELIDKLNSL